MEYSLHEGTATAPADTTATAEVKPRVRTDHHIWGTYILLVLVALVELFSASIQEVSDNSIFNPVLRHGGFIAAGLVLMLLLQKIHYRHIYRAIPCFVVLCIGMMLAVRVVGTEVNGAMRAIRIAGVPVLPAEFMKLGAALGMAWILTKNQVKGRRDVTRKGLWLCMGFMGVCSALLFSQGLSNTIVVVCICYSMMLVGGMGWRKFMTAVAIGVVVGGLALGLKTAVKKNVPLTPQQERVITLNKEGGDEGRADGRGNVWRERVKQHFRGDKHKGPFTTEHQQEYLSYIAQAHGGLFGVGIGRSRENARLPLAFSDYIFAIIIEELGLFVGLGILVCYMWILGRSAKLTMRFKQTMPGVLVMGCAFVVVFQALYHMAIVSGVFPVSGQPLPLISKGGISVIATSLAFGVMLSVARHAVRTTDTKAEQRQEQEILPEDARSVNPSITDVVEE
ncbi:MAG: FtsW/RodA/SpoVE family cell cycle protein [Muribaculaceae bacterium]|nr:FtsW/RodA/SpoVE family cell cycle protein [Muribaculaceae bacterium]